MIKAKSAVDFDQAAERPSRPTPTGRVSTPYQCVEAHGATDITYTPDQTTRRHEEAKDPAAKSQGAITPGEDGMDNAKRRFQAIHKRRQETAAPFDRNRKKSSSV
jgi:hypothetical protein